MQFIPTRPKRPPRENIVPMINVVFLLLIFFLMTAQIAPPDPFETIPPDSSSEAMSDGPATFYIGHDGALALGQARGEEAVMAALALLPKDDRVLIRADAGTKASTLAGLLAKLAAIGITQVALVTAHVPN